MAYFDPFRSIFGPFCVTLEIPWIQVLIPPKGHHHKPVICSSSGMDVMGLNLI